MLHCSGGLRASQGKCCTPLLCGRHDDRLVGLMVKASASRAEDRGSSPTCAGIFPGHTNDLKIGSPVAALPGAWR